MTHQAWHRCADCGEQYSDHLGRFGECEFKPLPPLQRHRMFADFTGLHAEEDAMRHNQTYSVTEMARMRAEAEEEGSWEQPPFDTTIQVHVVANDEAVEGLIRTLDENRDFVRKHLGVPRVSRPLPANDGPQAIGLSGFAQTGKTTVANYLEEKYGYRRQHIAEPLRDMLRTLLRRFGMPDTEIDEYLTGSKKEQVIPCLGKTSRHAQITIGTEWGREMIDDDLWARLWKVEADRQGGRAMNDSVRFPNEEFAIQTQLGGFTILVVRPGTKPVAYKWGGLGRKLYEWFGCMWGVHPSERIDLLSPDYTVVNDGSLEALYCKIDEIMEREQLLR